MSHNSYIRPAGIWGSGLPVLHGEFAGFDLSQFKAVNGDDGGTWANASPITFGGGFTVGGITTLNGTANVSAMNFFGLASFAANIVVNSYATFNGAISAASTLTVGAVTTLSGNLIANATATFNGANTFVGVASFNAQVNFNHLAVVNNGVTVFSDITLAGPGKVIERTVVGGDADGTYAVTSYDTVFMHALTADRTYRVSESGASNGTKIRFVFQNDAISTGKVTLLRDSDNSNLLVTLAGVVKLGTGSGDYQSVLLQYLSGSWQLADGNRRP